MDLDSYRKRLWASWVALPTIALHVWLVWDRLPARIPTKHDASDRATAWASRGDTLTILLGVLAFVLVVTTGAGHVVAHQRPDRARAALIVTYVVVGILWLLENRFVWSLVQG